MKKLLLPLLAFLFSPSAFALMANEQDITTHDVYQAAEELSAYTHEKDPARNASQTYRQILDNVDRRGLEDGLIHPLRKFQELESNPEMKDRLTQILGTLGEKKRSSPKRRNLDIVANVSNECISKCIDDVLNGAEKGARIGATIGALGGAGVGIASGAAGGIIGGSLGGVQCSVRKECNPDKDQGTNKLTLPPNYQLDHIKTEDLAQTLQKRKDIVINYGPNREFGE